MTESFETAVRMHETGDLNGAARIFSEIVRTNPRHCEAVYRLGAIHFQSGNFNEAEQLFAAATRIDGSIPVAFYSRGCALQNLGRHEEALTAYARALALKPDYAEARNNRGSSLLSLGRHEEALLCFDKVLAVRPSEGIVHGNRASALSGLKRYAEALAAAEEAVRRAPGEANNWFQRGNALLSLHRTEDAIRAYDKAIALKPDHADALFQRGLAAATAGRHEEALEFYGRALAFSPDNAHLLNRRANALLNLRRIEEAITECEEVLRVDPAYKFVRGNLLHAKLQICDWRDYEAERYSALESLNTGAPALQPLQTILVSHSPAEQLRSAQIWAASEISPQAPLWRGERYAHERIRIAYVSADFRDHAVAQAMAGVFEHHDKTRFDISAVSLNARTASPMRERLERSLGRITDASGRGDLEIATQLRGMEIDILVDLMGYTDGARPQIFAARPAPVQVNFLGYPGTMGVPSMDYLIADAITAPLEHAPHYSERIVHLPDSYMPSDFWRVPALQTPSRAEAGLPERGFVFASFNTAAKFNPPIFDIWMRLLTAVEGSVLWIQAPNDAALRNLKREAELRGVSPERIVLAPFVNDSEAHLARLSFADLFLDTLPYNAHAGAVDALKAGVPIVTSMGSAFAGRVAASILSAAGLPELAVSSLREYEALALSLARDGERLAALRRKLAANIADKPLFDTARFTRSLEAAFTIMHGRQARAEPPASFAVPPP